jgi:hypothetical protein
VAYWWTTLRILVGGIVSLRRLARSVLATAPFYVGMLIVFSVFFSNMVTVTSEKKEYGPIGPHDPSS